MTTSRLRTGITASVLALGLGLTLTACDPARTQLGEVRNEANDGPGAQPDEATPGDPGSEAVAEYIELLREGDYATAFAQLTSDARTTWGDEETFAEAATTGAVINPALLETDAELSYTITLSEAADYTLVTATTEEGTEADAWPVIQEGVDYFLQSPQPPAEGEGVEWVNPDAGTEDSEGTGEFDASEPVSVRFPADSSADPESISYYVDDQNEMTEVDATTGADGRLEVTIPQDDFETGEHVLTLVWLEGAPTVYFTSTVAFQVD
ncbi:hypothetical protein [Desertivibrio insolitus]|uniref:hypothetical protein n=1 Tax=Herbiconiux sp. SYSU D00978 TaxID=2812562 RepID=UPI001A97108F|nr:hypothetical protein [Herbiconiux sp. SYSU D00978]